MEVGARKAVALLVPARGWSEAPPLRALVEAAAPLVVAAVAAVAVAEADAL